MILASAASLSSVEVVGFVISIFSIIVSVGVSIYLFWLTSARGMAYDILFENSKLIGTQTEYRMRIKLWNSGRTAIETNDYDGEPITFKFGSNANIEEAEVVDTVPKLLMPKINLSNNAKEVIIGQKIPMLDKNESITFEVKVQDYSRKLEVIYHIKGIHKLLETPHNLNRNIKICTLLTATICTIFLIITIFLALSGKGVINQNFDLIGVVIVWGGLLVRSAELKWKRLYPIIRSLPAIMFVILSYLIIHISTIAYLPSFLSLGGVK